MVLAVHRVAGPTRQPAQEILMSTPTTAHSSDTPPADATTPITADIFHDLTCPWCRIGVAALRRALDGWDGPPVEFHWHPFLLDPGAPAEGQPFHATMTTKMGQDPAPMFARVSEVGREVGLTFNWDAIQRLPNTVAAHVLYAILPPGQRTGMIDRLHSAYFEEGRDIGDPATLRTIAEEFGMDGEKTAVALGLDELRQAIQSEAGQAAELGIGGVPLVIFDNRLTVPGAQPAEVFRSTLDRIVAIRAEGS
jgi:predicted DsbA family dithiol-disulfide isomerase